MVLDFLIQIVPGILVLLGDVPYLIGVWRKKIENNITGWIMWSVITGLLLFNCEKLGVEENLWPLRGTMTIVATIVIVSIAKRWGKFESMKFIEIVCVFLFILTLLIFFTNKDKNLSLYLLLVAEVLATVPTIVLVWKNPEKDRPFPWIIFAVGYLYVIGMLPSYSLKNLALPATMFIGSVIIFIPLIYYRIKKKIPLKEWI